MIVRHLVDRGNVDRDGAIIDPVAVRHGTIVARRVGSLAGPIDPATHLNLDFPGHVLANAVVVEELILGAAVVLDPTGEAFQLASPRRTAFQRRGRVDVDARRAAWQRVARDASATRC